MLQQNLKRYSEDLDDELDALYEQHIDREIQSMIRRKDEDKCKNHHTKKKEKKDHRSRNL